MNDVNVAAFVMDGRFIGLPLCFLVEERLDQPYSPAWIIPGGKIERFENASGAFMREMREETGVRPIAWTDLPSVPRPNGVPGLIFPFLVSSWEGHVPVRSLDRHARRLKWEYAAKLCASPVPAVRDIAVSACKHLGFQMDSFANP